MRLLLWLGTFVVMAGGCGPKPVAPPRQISEAEMIASAREHLPWFLERLAAADPADRGFRVIARMPAEGGRGAPDIALQDIVVEGDMLAGTVVKTKEGWPEYAAGKSYRISRGVVVDWSFVHKDRTMVDRTIGAFRVKAQMCNVGQMLEGLRGKTDEAEKVVKDLQTALEEKRPCEPYDPRADYAGG